LTIDHQTLHVFDQVKSGSLMPDSKMVSAGVWVLSAAGLCGHPLYALLQGRLDALPPARMGKDQVRSIGQVGPVQATLCFIPSKIRQVKCEKQMCDFLAPPARMGTTSRAALAR